MSKTDMVRCKGLVEATRVLVVDVMGKEIEREGAVEESGPDTEMETDGEASTVWDEVGEIKWEMDAARVYEMTLVQLGGRLDAGAGYTVADTSS